jgi:probable phosphoglycerate mutase
LSTPGVVAVSHVSPIKAAVCIALGADERASWRMQLSLASITRVDARDDGRAYLLSFNETAHLTPN